RGSRHAIQSLLCALLHDRWVHPRLPDSPHRHRRTEAPVSTWRHSPVVTLKLVSQASATPSAVVSRPVGTTWAVSSSITTQPTAALSFARYRRRAARSPNRSDR